MTGDAEATAGGPFQFTDAMHALMSDIVVVCGELRHIDMTRVAVSFSQARHSRLHGERAGVYPLRFEGGGRRKAMRGHVYEIPQVIVNGREMLYIVTFMLPRFLDLSFDEKMVTVVHELYHISPRFDGDVRRFAGGKPYHTGSRRRYDAAMARIAEAYLAQTRRPELHAFLRLDFRQLVARYGGVVGLRLRRPTPYRVG